MNNNKFLIQESRFNAQYVAFLLFGVQLVSFLPSLLNVSAQLFLWGANILVFLWSVVIILRSFSKRSFKLKVSFALIIFLTVYCIRMFHDLFIAKIYTNTFPNPTTYLIYFFGICMLPSIAINQIRTLDFYYALRMAYRILFLIIVLALALNLSGGMAADSGIELRSQGNDSMGSLTFGHLGVTFAILSLFRYRKERKKKFLLLMMIGIFAMAMAGSRSPLLALMVVIFLIYQGNKGIIKPLVVLSIIIAPILVFWDKIVVLLYKLDVGIIFRTLQAIEENKSSGRDILYEQVIFQILRSPFFGDAFLVTEGSMVGFYPHNFILESLLVTGIFGTLFLLYWLINVLRKAYNLIKIEDQNSWLAFLLIQFIIYGLFSKSFYTNQYFWYYSFLILNCYEFYFRQKNN